MSIHVSRFLVCLLAGLVAENADAQVNVTADTPDIPAGFAFPDAIYDYKVRIEQVPMRDGVRLNTLIVIPEGAHRAPMLLTRTPYDARSIVLGKRAMRMADTLPPGDAVFAEAGYIRVYQDVRGKYGSEGDYFMVPPLRGTVNAAVVDDTTDAWDTIDWLVRHVAESNGKVGMIGASYDGFTVAAALVEPHPALKAAVPENPMIDSWMGDDWFHHGAFRNVNMGYFTAQMAARGAGPGVPKTGYDDYANYLQAGSSGQFASDLGMERLPFWVKITRHPAYDGFWEGQAIDRILARVPLRVPTLWVHGLWDHVDMWGAMHAYAAMEGRDAGNDMNYLVMGPWHHGQQNIAGSSLGALSWSGDTSQQFRTQVLKPFLDAHLVDGAAPAGIAPVTAYETGTGLWMHYGAWPPRCTSDCVTGTMSAYLLPGGRLGFDVPKPDDAGYDEYLSDPAHPVPNMPRPSASSDGQAWRAWAVADQRFVDGRPDVVSFVSERFERPVHIAGAPEVSLYASTSGSDSDWVVKVIDVYPDHVPLDPKMGGYQLPLSMDIFRGRYRRSFARPQALAPGKPEHYTFALPNINHVLQPGHRLMVQMQSSWFPMYDRNPQIYVDNIFFAKPDQYRRAWQRIWHTPAMPSVVVLPIVTP